MCWFVLFVVVCLLVDCRCWLMLVVGHDLLLLFAVFVHCFFATVTRHCSLLFLVFVSGLMVVGCCLLMFVVCCLLVFVVVWCSFYLLWLFVGDFRC